jgi:hypothetical protein
MSYIEFWITFVIEISKNQMLMKFLIQKLGEKWYTIFHFKFHSMLQHELDDIGHLN